MIGWLSPTRWLVLLGLAIALTVGYNVWKSRQQELGAERARVEFDRQLSDQKLKAATLLRDKMVELAASREEFRKFKEEQEVKDAKYAKTVAAQERRLRDLSNADGRLRDPNAKGCRCSGVDGPGQKAPAASPDSGTTDGTETGGLLSTELSGLLKRLLKESDDINIAYASCRADGAMIRKIVSN